MEESTQEDWGGGAWRGFLKKVKASACVAQQLRSGCASHRKEQGLPAALHPRSQAGARPSVHCEWMNSPWTPIRWHIIRLKERKLGHVLPHG